MENSPPNDFYFPLFPLICTCTPPCPTSAGTLSKFHGPTFPCGPPGLFESEGGEWTRSFGGIFEPIKNIPSISKGHGIPTFAKRYGLFCIRSN
ncbi:hypothetical protein CDAR_612121 [Caerostris darwini]|uniref:Uncharacterized protein n=1 Tax=Caerostris darwini TaxID=1538125 RepID=A0AAV4S1W3_9ARAC|nr:hypothetical protein CDAR_612121 [Caerostris darwini]